MIDVAQNIVIEKRTTRIYLYSEQEKKYQRDFAKYLVISDFQILESYRKSHRYVDTERSHCLLEYPEVWKEYFRVIKNKLNLDDREMKLVKEFDNASTILGVNPFDFYIYFQYNFELDFDTKTLESLMRLFTVMGIPSFKRQIRIFTLNKHDASCKVNISTIVNEIGRVAAEYFKNTDHYFLTFANHLSDTNFDVLESFRLTYPIVEKIRASNLLNNSSLIWKHYFRFLVNKTKPSKKEIIKIKAYNDIKDLFVLDPIDLISYYVDLHEDLRQPISTLISMDSVKNLEILIYLYDFSEKIERNSLTIKVKERIKEELEQIELVKNTEMEKRLTFIKRRCKKFGIDVEEVLEPVFHN